MHCFPPPPHPSLEGKRLRALSRKHGGERGETPEGAQGCERAGGKGQPAREGSVPSPPALRCQTERDTSQGRLGWWTRCQGQWTRCVNHLKEVSKNGDSGWGASLQKESHLGGRCPDRLPGGGSPRVGRPGSQHVSRATLPAAPPPPRTGDVLPQNRLKFSLRPDCPSITSASSHMRSHAPRSPWAAPALKALDAAGAPAWPSGLCLTRLCFGPFPGLTGRILKGGAGALPACTICPCLKSALGAAAATFAPGEPCCSLATPRISSFSLCPLHWLTQHFRALISCHTHNHPARPSWMHKS